MLPKIFMSYPSSSWDSLPNQNNRRNPKIALGKDSHRCGEEVIVRHDFLVRDRQQDRQQNRHQRDTSKTAGDVSQIHRFEFVVQ